MMSATQSALGYASIFVVVIIAAGVALYLFARR